MPAATPACARGMPETAVFVMGAFTHAKPKPNTTYAVIRYAIDVCGSRPVSITPETISPAPAMTSGQRVPYAPTNLPHTGPKTSDIRAIGRVASPVCSGEYPRTSCRYSVLRNRNPDSAANPHTAMTVADENG